MNSIDEIKKLKELLDEGAITHDEFEILKKGILINSESAKNEYVPYVSKAKQASLIKTTEAETNQSASVLMTNDNRNEKTYNDSITSMSDKLKDNVTKNDNHEGKISQEEAIERLRQMNIAYSQKNLVNYSENGNQSVVDLLLTAGLNPNVSYMEGGERWYAIHLAALEGHNDILNLLIKKGAKVNLQDDFGYTALFCAIENGNIEGVKLLLENGANINIKTSDGHNPISYARNFSKFNKNEIIDTLKRAGTNELTNNQVSTLERPLFLKRVKLIGVFVGLIFLVGWCVTSTPSSSKSGSDASSQYAELHCPWCQEVQKSNNGKGLVYYEWVDGGVSWNQFYDGIKYECCSERCCRLFHSANKD